LALLLPLPERGATKTIPFLLALCIRYVQAFDRVCGIA
jgi:hypothetical protein